MQIWERPGRRTRCEAQHRSCGSQWRRQARSSRGECRWRVRLGPGVSRSSRICWRWPKGEPWPTGSPRTVRTATLFARLPPFSALGLFCLGSVGYRECVREGVQRELGFLGKSRRWERKESLLFLFGYMIGPLAILLWAQPVLNDFN